jgi:DNA replication and repair protein RecF
MTLVRKIRVQHVRAHEDFSMAFDPNVTVIIGPNGSGKTSIIESVYITLQGTSFKGGDGDIIQREAPWYRVDVWCDDGERTVKFDPTRQVGRKQFIIDEKTNYRLLPRFKWPVVLFEPDDLRLLGGSPARRRQFLDQFIGQIDMEYGAILRRYDRALKQRNALLKRPGVSNDDLFAWNVSLSEYAAFIIAKRLEFIGMLDEQLGTVYKIIAKTNDSIAVRYSIPSHHGVRQKILADLHAHTEKDKLLGFTSVGPHRHDVLFDFNQTPAASGASRGEIRSILLALKFIEVEIIERLSGKKPIILLDDVFSELDDIRQKNLVTEFKNHQIIVTSTTGAAIKGSSIIELPTTR